MGDPQTLQKKDEIISAPVNDWIQSRAPIKIKLALLKLGKHADTITVYHAIAPQKRIDENIEHFKLPKNREEIDYDQWYKRFFYGTRPPKEVSVPHKETQIIRDFLPNAKALKKFLEIKGPSKYHLRVLAGVKRAVFDTLSNLHREKLAKDINKYKVKLIESKERMKRDRKNPTRTRKYRPSRGYRAQGGRSMLF